MKNPWENCTHEDGWNGFEGAVVKHERGIWSDETFANWLNEYCECCPFLQVERLVYMVTKIL